MGEREITTQRSVATTVRENSTWLTLILIGVVMFGAPRVEAAGFTTAATALYAVAIVVAVVLLVSAVRELRERL